MPHLAEYLHLAHACLTVQYPALDDDFKLHLASIAETIGHSVSKACNIAWSDNPARNLIPLGWGETISEDFRRTMLFKRSNCCPSQWSMLLQGFKNPCALCIIADTFHDEAAQPQHDQCSELLCQLRYSLPDGRITRHISDACECEHVSVDESQLVKCLDEGKIPLIKIQEGIETNTVSIKVVPSTSSSPYVALSHVWADGLGNPEATALPRCQLLRLKSRLDKLNTSDFLREESGGQELLLWCDTLCCPVSSKRGKEMALSKMYRMYNEAFMVLVLEEKLARLRVKEIGFCEASLRIVLSQWMTRLWTLQEGALPAKSNKLFFQFADYAVRVQTLYRHVASVSHKTVQWRGIASDIMRRFHTFINLLEADTKNPERQVGAFKEIMQSLRYRSVTIPFDEPLIIATLLGLDLDEILKRSAEDRMKAMWKLLGSSSQGIPRDLLFYLGPKLSDRGLRWAPRSLLEGQNLFFFRRSGMYDDRGYLTDQGSHKGLLVHLAGLRISLATPAASLPAQSAGYGTLPAGSGDRRNLLLKDDQGLWYMLTHRLTGVHGFSPALEDMSQIISNLGNPWILHHGSESSKPSVTAYEGLLVDRVSTQQSMGQEPPCVEIKSNVSFGRLPRAGRQCCETICQAAYTLAQDLSTSTIVRGFEEWEGVHLDDSDYVHAAHGVDLEVERLSRSTVAIEALLASGNSPDEHGSACMSEYIERFFRGIYMNVEEFASGDSKWFVD
ncbi:MAG: hypothetical protein Q9219_007059 [cf. Caloplaca sp. 3 TL-2023]